MARITIAPVIYRSFLRKDGSYSIKMRVTCNRASRFIMTSEIAQPSQLTRSLGIKDPGLINRLRQLEGKMRQAVSDLDLFDLEDRSIDDIIAHMSRRINGEFRLEFFGFWETAVADKPPGSKANYMVALRNFKKFTGVESLDISQVTSRLMVQYQAYLERAYGKGARAVTMYTGAVKHVHSLARRMYNNDEFGDTVIRNPFDFYTPPRQSPSQHRNVDRSVIQTMMDQRSELQGRERRAVDAYLLSFALMGMNAPDLLSCAPPDDNGVIIYNRQKTKDRRADKAEIHVKVEPCILPIFNDWCGTDGVHAFSFHKIHANYRQFDYALAKGLAVYRERMGIPKGGLDFYSARHAWATIAYSIGIDKGIINDCLCHVDAAMKVTDIYISKDWSVLWEANRKVLALFNWPQ